MATYGVRMRPSQAKAGQQVREGPLDETASRAGQGSSALRVCAGSRAGEIRNLPYQRVRPDHMPANRAVAKLIGGPPSERSSAATAQLTAPEGRPKPADRKPDKNFRVRFVLLSHDFASCIELAGQAHETEQCRCVLSGTVVAPRYP